MFDDRGIYRPGETVRLTGWVRRFTSSTDAQLALLENAENLPGDPDRPSRFMPILPRLVMAGLVVRTPAVALPGVETPVDVAARPKGSD